MAVEYITGRWSWSSSILPAQNPFLSRCCPRTVSPSPAPSAFAGTMGAAPLSLHRSTSHRSSSAIAAPTPAKAPRTHSSSFAISSAAKPLGRAHSWGEGFGTGLWTPLVSPQEKSEGSRASQPCWRCFLVVPLPEVRGHTAISWGSARSRPRLRWPEKHLPGKKGFPWDGSAIGLAARTSSCELP